MVVVTGVDGGIRLPQSVLFLRTLSHFLSRMHPTHKQGLSQRSISVIKYRRAPHKNKNLRPLTADAASELDVLRHDSDALGVDSTHLSVFKEPDEVRLGRLL